MSDIQLYRHCEEYIHEVHKFDGMCFVEPYNYQEFVQGLDIQDSESGFDAYVSSGGTLCFKIDELEPFFSDFDSFREAFINKFGS